MSLLAVLAIVAVVGLGFSLVVSRLVSTGFVVGLAAGLPVGMAVAFIADRRPRRGGDSTSAETSVDRPRGDW